MCLLNSSFVFRYIKANYKIYDYDKNLFIFVTSLCLLDYRETDLIKFILSCNQVYLQRCFINCFFDLLDQSDASKADKPGKGNFFNILT